MSDPNANTGLDACKKRFYLAKVSGEWQQWILKTERPWSIPPWRPLGAEVVHALAKAGGGEIAALARHFCEEHLLELEQKLRERQQREQARDEIEITFNEIRKMFSPSDPQYRGRVLAVLCEPFVEFACNYETEEAPGTAALSSETVARLNPNGESAGDRGPSGTGRRARVDAYIEEVSRAGKRIRRTDIWKHAGYKSRTEFEKWERGDPKKVNKTAHEHFTNILTQKPHLK